MSWNFGKRTAFHWMIDLSTVHASPYHWSQLDASCFYPTVTLRHTVPESSLIVSMSALRRLESRAIDLFDAGTTLATVTPHVKGISVDFKYFPKGTWPQFFLCASIKALCLHPVPAFAAFVFCPDRSHSASEPCLQVYDVGGT